MAFVELGILRETLKPVAEWVERMYTGKALWVVANRSRLLYV